MKRDKDFFVRRIGIWQNGIRLMGTDTSGGMEKKRGARDGEVEADFNCPVCLGSC